MPKPPPKRRKKTDEELLVDGLYIFAFVIFVAIMYVTG